MTVEALTDAQERLAKQGMPIKLFQKNAGASAGSDGGCVSPGLDRKTTSGGDFYTGVVKACSPRGQRQAEILPAGKTSAVGAANYHVISRSFSLAHPWATFLSTFTELLKRATHLVVVDNRAVNIRSNRCRGCSLIKRNGICSLREPTVSPLSTCYRVFGRK